ncbi:uncharacterized protein LOC132741324 [Ruditapes philippinarum]|uniref:uncharacterized protein LOC132741324 n=1 Tax=Ruditapes philippinarum TaxID=129788 RepID=UPI00295B7769|nr:uncharacterized protein LOC132741324 [Ruditapes philippinarum]XP_060585441.1 uncharacterized protein LOC132741324 [Ruditapes philippinarum]XP_060585442.1 uncharacterized protein LOC132741324 [Ruditapes philippinarum]XP_060585443.1 uncharacterized protein LOC132741324 [Ruditapes philippinarum]XP_060585444.1 uncharacterized protein LOC132741324 [Ruditapes philippinarum]XP_060585446.1 uncharacterized protein LOC132741324 [Ruditapes philippinarum]XP_060585447.1 uncharacterized protein LOC13274
MLKHRVQTAANPQHDMANYAGTQNDVTPSSTVCSGSQSVMPADAVNYSGAQQNIQSGTHNNDGSRPDIVNNINVQTGHYTGYNVPPPVADNAQYNQTQIVNEQGYHGYQDQQYIPQPTPSNLVKSGSYNSISGDQPPNMNSQEFLQPPQDAKEGIRIITKKYDSLNKLTVSPQKSPLGSPSSDGGTFSFADMIMSQKYREGVTEQDLLQVDTFYRSHKSEVFVCGCLVNMYFGSSKAALDNEQWTFSTTGIPLLLLDSGEHHRERKLYIILAEKGTGFTMWRDVIDNQTGYRTPNANFHTMHTSKDHSQLAGFSFDDAKAASEFYGHIHKLTADPEDDLLKIGKTKKKKSIKDKKKKFKLPKKAEISQPCCFVHVTKLDRPMTEDNESSSSAKGANSNEISAPYNFQHVTGPPGSGNDLSNLMGSKLTLTSTSSVDSGLSEDRGSSKTGN